MKKSKIILVMAMVIAMLVTGLVGCSKSTDKDTTTDSNTTDSTAELTAADVAVLMGNGINLGNTMEAYGHTTLGIDKDPTDYETSWGQPVTTKAMIEGMKTAGFDSIRIPVAWTNMMDVENKDYTINTKLLDRVQEIVDYAIDADMYVIVNDHWDGGWWGMFGSATQETRDEAMKLYTSMWTQIAERFKDYDNRLILESGNEELGSRLNDITDFSPDSGSLSEDECYTTANEINQTFVDIIRKSGSNNEDRFLLIAGYNTDIDKTCDDRFVMPTDTATDKLLLSVHYYTPWSYCGGTTQTSWKSEAAYTEMNTQLEKMTKFTEAGIPVVIGEYGALLTSDGEYKNNTVEFTANLLANCDLYGMVPMLWDTNSFYIRTSEKIENADYAKLFADNAYSSVQKDMSADEVKKAAQATIDAGLETGKANDAMVEETTLSSDGKSIAWIMYYDGSWAGYSVGDTYNPSQTVDGLKATDVEVTGAGTYTVALDFTGTANKKLTGMLFSALGISNGETMYPGYIVNIKEIKINGEAYTLKGTPFTTSDDKLCTRVNLFNSWVTSIPDEARTDSGVDASTLSAQIIDGTTIKDVTTIEITFDYGPAK